MKVVLLLGTFLSSLVYLVSQTTMKSCTFAALKESVDIFDPLLFKGTEIADGHTVQVLCKLSSEVFKVYCENGSWIFVEANCLEKSTAAVQAQKRRKRFVGVAVIAIVFFTIGIALSSPRPRDTTPPYFVNCPENKYTHSAYLKRHEFIDWIEPDAYDDKSEVRVRQEGRRSGSPFFEGDTQIKYSAKDRSGNMGFCSFNIHLEVIRCPKLNSEIADGYRLCHPSVDMVWGTVCRYGCYQGHELKGGPSTKECLRTGEWSSSSEPYCEKAKCKKLSPKRPTSVKCSNQFYYRSICSYFCAEGYEIPDRVSRAKVCLASKEWNGGNPQCKDIEPPTFDKCHDTLMFFPGDNQDKAYVNWTEPSVSDNEDTEVVPRQIAGPSQAASLNVGTYIITYGAKDRAGNEAEPCSFTVVVKQLRCRRMYPLPYMSVNCTGTRQGSVCSFSCDSNSELNGTNHTYCKRVHEMQYSMWDLEKQPFCQVSKTCPDISAPDNGAMACKKWLGGRICHPSCRMGYTVAKSDDGIPLPKFVICTHDRKWKNKDKVKNCYRKAKLKQLRKRAAVMRSEFFFNGDCHHPKVQFEIRVAFLAMLSNEWKSKCSSKCYIENIQVICGNTSGKRSTTNMAIEMTLVFESNETISSELYEEEASRTIEVAEAIETTLLSINITSNKTLNLVSFSSGSLEIECTNNSVPVYGSDIGCVPCPTGTFFVADNKTCEPCPRGSYQPLASQRECLLCSPTETTAMIGSTNSSECENACEPGTWSPTGLPPCMDCDIGYYEEFYGSIKCSECPGNKITVHERSSDVSDCFDFDIIFPNGTEESTTTFDDPIDPVSLPFAVSFHVKLKSSEGHILTMSEESRDIVSIDSLGVRFNGKYKTFPLEIDLMTKWFHLSVSVEENETTVYIDGKSSLVFDELDSKTFSSVKMYLGGDGFVGEISQLIVSEDSDFLSKLHSYASCNSNDDIVGSVNWKDFAYSSLNNSYIKVPSYCDDVDACNSNPCLNGTCTDRLGGFKCKCYPGFTGITCDINIDDCISHMCQNNATCVDGITNYTCACNYGFTGELCEIPMVDGQWSQWDEWSDCSITCGNGTKQRHRSCSNPQPDNGGMYCEGNDTDVEECVLEPCRECFDLVATNHSSLTCTNTSDMIVCKHTCDDGYWFDKDVRDEYKCGNETYYYWDFQTEDNPYARLPFCSEINEASKIYLDHTAYYDLDHCGDNIMDIVMTKLSVTVLNLRCKNASFCELEEYEVLNCGDTRRDKRDLTSATVGYTVTISCDPKIHGTEDCAYNLADGIREIKLLENGTFFDIEYNSEIYHIDTNKSKSGTRMDCEPGTIQNMIFCVPCSVGHYYNDEECIPCRKGTYQVDAGQTFCSRCPEFTTTEGTASISLDDCNVVVPDDTNNTHLYVIGTFSGLSLAALVIFIIHRRNTIIEKTTYKFGIDLSFKSEGKTVEKNTDDGGVNLMSYVLKSDDMCTYNQHERPQQNESL